jgi:hypothetical protein
MTFAVVVVGKKIADMGRFGVDWRVLSCPKIHL